MSRHAMELAPSTTVGYLVNARLHGSYPEIWRSFVISEKTTLWELHCALTDMFGWMDSHLHEFHIPLPVQFENTKRRLLCMVPFGIPEEDEDPTCLADWSFTIADLVTLGSPSFIAPKPDLATIDIANQLGIPVPEPTYRGFKYTYDLGDDWIVWLTVTGVEETSERIVPRDGARSGPPDDFGGIARFNAYVGGKGSAEERTEIAQWIQGQVGDWSPEDWTTESIQLSDAHYRLKNLFEHDNEIKGAMRGTPKARLNRFVRNNQELIHLIIDDVDMGLATWFGTVQNGIAYIIGQEPRSENESIRPDFWSRRTGKSPAESVKTGHRLWGPYIEATHQRLDYFLISLPCEYAITDSCSEVITEMFLLIYPSHEVLNKFKVWKPIGKRIVDASLETAMQNAIHQAYRLDGTAEEKAARAFILATFDPECRKLLGLESNEIIAPLP